MKSRDTIFPAKFSGKPNVLGSRDANFPAKSSEETEFVYRPPDTMSSDVIFSLILAGNLNWCVSHVPSIVLVNLVGETEFPYRLRDVSLSVNLAGKLNRC